MFFPGLELVTYDEATFLVQTVRLKGFEKIQLLVDVWSTPDHFASQVPSANTYLVAGKP